MVLEFFIHLAEICHQQMLRTVVLSPGSRVAPLTLAFVRQNGIQTYTLSDERSAGFTALGIQRQIMSQDQESDTFLPLVGLACTSGTALYNYAPAVAEAFYQEIPLVLFTADRPPEWVNQQDNQAIQQRSIYGKHVKGSFETPVDMDHPDALWSAHRIINEAILLARQFPRGPVHVNIPIREPFYPQSQEPYTSSLRPQIIQRLNSQAQLSKKNWNQLLDIWDDAPKKLMVVGQYLLNQKLCDDLTLLQKDFKIPIVGDIISNMHPIEGLIQCHDTFLLNPEADLLESLRPELLISFGQPVLSKALKNFLRKHPPNYHWQIREGGNLVDTFQSLSHLIPLQPEDFFRQLYEDLDFLHLLEHDEEGVDSPFYEHWQAVNRAGKKYLEAFEFSESLTELEVAKTLMPLLPDKSILHLGNSMPVRYANFIGLGKNQSQLEVMSNRGTSGIDGSLSTAVGSAIQAPERLVFLLIGDLSFFYDRNGLWNNALPPNLRIILLNNQGGNIFRMISGPREQPEMEKYFETFQILEAENTARDFQLDYFKIQTIAELLDLFPHFIQESNQSKLLEIQSDKERNADFYQKYRQGYSSRIK